MARSKQTRLPRLEEPRRAPDDDVRYSAVFGHLPIPLVVLSAAAEGDPRVMACNAALLHRINAREGEVVGEPIWPWFARGERSLVRAGLRAVARGDLSTFREECRLCSRRGRISAILEATRLPGGETVLSLVDITDRTESERDLAELAFHDPLTGVANRAELEQRLDDALAESPPRAALLVVDLDDFKAVNDSLGHAAGDRVLVAVARRLKACVREDDTVARIGGDEFALLITQQYRDGVHPASVSTRAARLASRAKRAITEPIHLADGHTVRVGSSVGLRLLDTSDTPLQALAEADARMYLDKGYHPRASRGVAVAERHATRATPRTAAGQAATLLT
jgi:diguanylate cyclase (GGDEF)-like protein